MAAFAAEDPSVQASYFTTVDKNEDNNDVALNAEVEAKFEVNDAAGQPSANALNDVYVWAVDQNGNVTDAATITKAGAPVPAGNIANTVKLNVNNGDKVSFKFARTGTYKIYAGVDKTADTDAEKVADLTKLNSDSNYQTIVVTEESTDVDSMNLAANNAPGTKITEDAATTVTAPAIASNGIATAEVDVYVFNGTKVAKNEEVALSTSSANVVLDKDSLTTDRQGKITLKYTITKAGEYKVYLKADSYEGILKVVGSESAPDTITTVKEPKAPIDKDTNWNNKDMMDDYIQFEIKDTKGAILTNIGAEPIATGDKNYIKVVEQPSKSDLDGEDFKVVPASDKKFTLVTAEKLKEGKYVVRVALLNGKTAEVSFEVKKFGTAKELKLAFNAETIALGAMDVMPDDVKLVDADGVERNIKAADDVTFGYNGYAVDTFNTFGDTFKFDVKDDEKYLGQKITFTAVSKKHGLTAKAELIVGQDGQSIKFDSTAGNVDKDNKVIAQLVDGKGNTVSLGNLAAGAEIVAYVVKSSNPEAKVDVEAKDTGDLEKKGQFELTVSSNKTATADIAVYVKDANGKIYANTLAYTFGAKAGNANTNVVMTINSKDTIVNNKIVTIDAAPYIKMDRTFVPIRALVEDFGAKVDWNEKDRTVTVELDGNKVVMTIGSKDYTMNDAKKTMDVAPEIVNSRTMVPVRFVAEGLGFTVTPTYNTDGTTASVVFSK